MSTTTNTAPSPRESEALELFESGKPAADVASAMGIKEGHAYNLRNSALRKLGRGSEVGSTGGSGTRTRVNRFQDMDPLAITMVKSYEDVTESVRRAEQRVTRAQESVTEAEANLVQVTTDTETVIDGLRKGAKAMKVDLDEAINQVKANEAQAESDAETSDDETGTDNQDTGEES